MKFKKFIKSIIQRLINLWHINLHVINIRKNLRRSGIARKRLGNNFDPKERHKLQLKIRENKIN